MQDNRQFPTGKRRFRVDHYIPLHNRSKTLRLRLRVRDLTENRHPRKLHCTFDSPEKLALLSVLKEVISPLPLAK